MMKGPRFITRVYQVVVTVDHKYFDSPDHASEAVRHAIECVGNEYGMEASIVRSDTRRVPCADHVERMTDE